MQLYMQFLHAVIVTYPEDMSNPDLSPLQNDSECECKRQMLIQERDTSFKVTSLIVHEFMILT